MAQKDRFSEGDTAGQFPIHYERGGIRVFTNSSGELFVEQIRADGSDGVTMRFSPHTSEGLRFTAFGFLVEAEPVSNNVGFLVSKRP